MGVVPNPLYNPLCAPPDGIFQRREGNQDCSVAVHCDISSWHDNIKGSEGHLGYVFSAALLPLPQALQFGTLLIVMSSLAGENWKGRFSPSFHSCYKSF